MLKRILIVYHVNFDEVTYPVVDTSVWSGIRQTRLTSTQSVYSFKNVLPDAVIDNFSPFLHHHIDDSDVAMHTPTPIECTPDTTRGGADRL